MAVILDEVSSAILDESGVDIYDEAGGTATPAVFAPVPGTPMVSA